MIEHHSDPGDHALELDEAEMRGLVDRAMQRIVEHLGAIDEQPAGYDAGLADGAVAMRQALPETGTEIEAILDQLFEVAIPRSFNTASPGYMAYVPGGGIFSSAVAELIANAVNRYVGVWVAAPYLAEIESDVIRWFARVMGYPDTARGVLTSGGSMANFTAIFTARRERLPERFLDGRIYVGEHAHHSVARAALLAGFPESSLVTIGSDEHYRLRTDELEAAIAHDRDAGGLPFLVVASAGTTNTGAVDDLKAIAGICERQRLWLHVDAAYGGFFQLTDRGRTVLAGIERADSIVLDPHKGLFLPYGTGMLLVRDGPALGRAHAIQADYMPDKVVGADDDGRFDFCDHSMELSRPFRGLGVWLPLRLHGVAPFRRYLDEKLSLAEYAAERLREIDGIELVAAPQLSILAFRYVQDGLDEEQLDRLNRELLAKVLLTARVWLTPTTLEGRFVIRICVLHFRTHRDRVDEGLELIRQAAKEIACTST